MNFSFFGWIREKARQSVLLGLGDAIEDLDADEGAPDLDALRKRLAAVAPQKQLAAPEDEPAKGRKGK